MVHATPAPTHVRGRRHRPRRPARSAVLALVLGGIVLGLLPGCGPAPAAPPAPDPTCAPPAPAPTLAPGSLDLPARPSVLIMGDSYTEGFGAEPETLGYAYLVGRPLGWQVTIDGVGGTGFVNPGAHAEGTYLQRLPRLQGRTFDLVVLEGGTNDKDTAYPVVQDAVARTVQLVRAQFPGTAVVLMGPLTPYGAPNPTRVLLQCVIAGYAAQHYVPFLDPIGEQWFVDGDGSRYANPENGHPNNAGYRRVADRFVADLRVLTGATAPS